MSTGAEESHNQVMASFTTFEPVQYTRKDYVDSFFGMDSERIANECGNENKSEIKDKSKKKSKKKDRRAKIRFRTQDFSIVKWSHKVQAPTSAHTVDEQLPKRSHKVQAPASAHTVDEQIVKRSHKVQAPTSAHTVDEQTAGASSIANCFIDQEPQATNTSHGTRVPGLLLATLLTPRLQKDLFLAELPLELNASHMNAAYTMISVPVPDDTNFKARYSSLLRYFQKAQLLPEQKTRPTVFVLTSITNCTVKIITVAEKLKRDLKSCAIECFQYCAIQSRNVSVDHFNNGKRNRKGETAIHNLRADSAPKAATGSAEQAFNDNDEDEAFQTMTVAPKGSPTVAASDNPKLRRLPVMTIFLALTSVAELHHLIWLDSWVPCLINVIKLTIYLGNKPTDFCELSNASYACGVSGG